jgi:hypothetical protein
LASALAIGVGCIGFEGVAMAIYRFGAFELNDTTGAQLEFGTAQAIARKVSSSRLARRCEVLEARLAGAGGTANG